MMRAALTLSMAPFVLHEAAPEPAREGAVEPRLQVTLVAQLESCGTQVLETASALDGTLEAAC